MVGRFVGAVVLAGLDAAPRARRRSRRSRSRSSARRSVSPGTSRWSAILAVGLFNSIMFPTIFTLAIDGLGARTGEGSGVLCMAIVGGAIVPVLEGAVADHVGVHVAFVVPLVCYAYIAWYGLAGSKLRFRRAAARRRWRRDAHAGARAARVPRLPSRSSPSAGASWLAAARARPAPVAARLERRVRRSRRSTRRSGRRRRRARSAPASRTTTRAPGEHERLPGEPHAHRRSKRATGGVLHLRPDRDRRGHFAQAYGRFEASIQIPQRAGDVAGVLAPGRELRDRSGWPAVRRDRHHGKPRRRPDDRPREHARPRRGTLDTRAVPAPGRRLVQRRLPRVRARVGARRRALVRGQHLYETQTADMFPATSPGSSTTRSSSSSTSRSGGRSAGRRRASTAFPQSMLVDYVHVYARAGESRSARGDAPHGHDTLRGRRARRRSRLSRRDDAHARRGRSNAASRSAPPTSRTSARSPRPSPFLALHLGAVGFSPPAAAQLLALLLLVRVVAIPAWTLLADRAARSAASSAS